MAKEPKAFDKAVGGDHRIPLCSDLSIVDEAMVVCGKGIVLGPRTTFYQDMNHKKYEICDSMKFRTLLEFNAWIKEYEVKYFGPYTTVTGMPRSTARLNVRWLYSMDCVCKSMERRDPMAHIKLCIDVYKCTRGL
jgi:hypothetical protein